jgi:hypothetical protein
MTANFRHFFALWGFSLDRSVLTLLLWCFRRTDVAECNTEPTSPGLSGFRRYGS